MNAADGPQEPREGRVTWWAVFLGALLGFVASWTVFAVTVLGLYATYGDSTSTGQNIVAGLGLFGLPVILGLLLLRPRNRVVGAGFLLGLAIGSITGAGICAGFAGFNAI